MTNKNNRPSLFFPLLIVSVGIILLLKTLSIIDNESLRSVLRFWPVLLIIGGFDGFYQRNGYVGPTISIGAGIIFLLCNLGYIEVNIWSIILKFWPVLIIAAGFDLLFGRRSFLFGVIGIIIGISLLIGMVWLSGDLNNYDLNNNENINLEYNNTTTADISLAPKVSDLTITSGTSPKMLLEADILLGNRESLDKTIDQDNNQIALESSSSNYSYPFPTTVKNGSWDIKVNKNIPLNLQTDLIIGKQDLDLYELQLEEFNSKTIIGKNTIYLPRKGSASVAIELVIGELIIYLPENTTVNIEVDTGLTLVNLPKGYTKTGSSIKSNSITNSTDNINLEIDQPVGILTIKVY